MAYLLENGVTYNEIRINQVKRSWKLDLELVAGLSRDDIFPR